jgi:hypothetical protein
MWRENRALLIRGARALAAIPGEFVFVGGCTTGLLITDTEAPDVRATRDVDVIVEIASRSEYYALAGSLRANGFTEDREVICRWRSKQILILDLMPPTDSQILGFSNPWYRAAVANATERELEPGLTIRVVTPPYFCATKIVAFHGRGKGDYMASHDIEDLLTVVDGRRELAGEIRLAEPDVRRYVATEMRTFIAQPEFMDALPECLRPDASSQARLPMVMERLYEIASADTDSN